MGNQGPVEDRFRQRLRSERGRRGWSQAQLALAAERKGVNLYPSTIAKIESGDRAVRLDELNAFADLFGLSIEALAGLNGNRGDLMWAVSKMTTNAQTAARDIDMIHSRVAAELEDVKFYADWDNRTERLTALISSAQHVCDELESAHKALTMLADALWEAIGPPR